MLTSTAIDFIGVTCNPFEAFYLDDRFVPIAFTLGFLSFDYMGEVYAEGAKAHWQD